MTWAGRLVPLYLSGESGHGGVQGEACGQRTGLGLHACLMACPQAPPEARAGPAAAPLPQQSISSSSWARCVQGSGTQALASAGHLHHRDQRHLSVCVGCSSGSFSVFPTPGPYFSSRMSAVCILNAHITPEDSHLPKAPPSFPQLCEVRFWGIYVAVT